MSLLGRTLTLWLAATDPDCKAVIFASSAYRVHQLSLEEPPGQMDAGLAPIPPSGFLCTRKVVLSVCEPAGLRPVIVYLCSPWGRSFLEAVTVPLVPGTLPIPLLIDWLVVQLLLQFRLPLSPTVMSAGLAAMLTEGHMMMSPKFGSR